MLQMNLLTLAGQAAEAVVKNAKPTSFVATSSSNKAPLGQTNSAGLLVYTPATSVLDATDFDNFFSNSFANASIKGIALTAGAYTVGPRSCSVCLPAMFEAWQWRVRLRDSLQPYCQCFVLQKSKCILSLQVNNTMPSFHINLYCFGRPTNLGFELNFSGSTIYFGVSACSYPQTATCVCHSSGRK